MLLSSSAAYRLWAPYYDTVPNPLLALEERLVGELLPPSGFRTVIDVGCVGSGFVAFAVALVSVEAILCTAFSEPTLETPVTMSSIHP